MLSGVFMCSFSSLYLFLLLLLLFFFVSFIQVGFYLTFLNNQLYLSKIIFQQRKTFYNRWVCVCDWTGAYMLYVQCAVSACARYAFVVDDIVVVFCFFGVCVLSSRAACMRLADSQSTFSNQQFLVILTQAQCNYYGITAHW